MDGIGTKQDREEARQLLEKMIEDGTADAYTYYTLGIIYEENLQVDKDLGKAVGLNLITALSWSAMLKNCFFRRRPYFDHPEIKCLKTVDASAPAENLVAQGWSFPSAHSTSSVALYSTLPFYTRKLLSYSRY